MKVYLVAYDLKTDAARAKEEGFVKALKEAANGWWHHMDGFWLVGWNKQDTELRALLKEHFPPADGGDGYDPDVNIFVARIREPYFGWMPSAAWEWFKGNSLDYSSNGKGIVSFIFGNALCSPL